MALVYSHLETEVTKGGEGKANINQCMTKVRRPPGVHVLEADII